MVVCGFDSVVMCLQLDIPGLFSHSFTGMMMMMMVMRRRKRKIVPEFSRLMFSSFLLDLRICSSQIRA